MKATHANAFRRGVRAATVVAALLTFMVGAMPAAAASSKATSPAAASSRPALSGVVNVNTASAEELQLLPGVGSTRASAILEVRKARGRFGSVDELTDVKGIGPKMLERMRPHVAVKGRTTARMVDGSTSSATSKTRP